jgi:uncharacterized Tic20 family protein
MRRTGRRNHGRPAERPQLTRSDLMSENTGPVDPQAPSDPQSAVPDGTEEIPNEFSAPRPTGEPTAPADPGEQMTPRGQDFAYGQGSPYAQPSAYGEDEASGQPSPYGPNPGAQQEASMGAAPQGAHQQDGPQAGSYDSGQGAQQQGPLGGAPQGGPQQDAPGAAPAGEWSNTPPPNVKGVSTAPMTGQAATESDVKLWSMLAQLSSVIGYVISVGILGWLGPLIIFLVYKDRNRFIRYNAAEALNAAIAVVIADIVLAIVFGVFTLLTLGFGSPIFVLLGVPTILHIIFAIIGAVKANDRTWWNYPLNIRLVK